MTDDNTIEEFLTLFQLQQGKAVMLTPQVVETLIDILTDTRDLHQLHDLQRKRMDVATALWRNEDPEVRQHQFPDLGGLLDWLIRRGTLAKVKNIAAQKTIRQYGQAVEHAENEHCGCLGGFPSYLEGFSDRTAVDLDEPTAVVPGEQFIALSELKTVLETYEECVRPGETLGHGGTPSTAGLYQVLESLRQKYGEKKSDGGT